jgi:DNA-binding NarL/FixJ family response regulator
MLSLNESTTMLANGMVPFRHRSAPVFQASSQALAVELSVNAGKRLEELLAVLGRIGCGQIVIRHERVIDVSATARAILERKCANISGPEELYAAVKELAKRAGARIPSGSISWLATSLKESFTVFLNSVAIPQSDETTIVVLLDLDAHPEPNPVTLQTLFGFTVAETRLAIDLARGNTLNDVARSRRLSRTTTRSQLASLFVKTQTRRQAELVTLLGRVAVLP